MGFRQKFQAIILLSFISGGTGYFYVKGRTRKVQSIPADDATSYCATLIDKWRAEHALRKNYLFAYEVQTVVYNTATAKRLFGALERRRELHEHSDGSKEAQTRLVKVKPSPLLGSLYALQSLHHAWLLRSQRASHVFAETLRVSNVFYLWWSGTLRCLREVRNEFIALLPQSPALTWVEKGYYNNNNNNNNNNNSNDISNQDSNELEESESKWKQLLHKMHLRKAHSEVSNVDHVSGRGNSHISNSNNNNNRNVIGKVAQESKNPTEKLEKYCRALSELGMDTEIIALPTQYEAVIHVGGDDGPIVGVSLSPTPPNPRLHPFTPTRVVTAHVFYAAPIHEGKYVQRMEY